MEAWRWRYMVSYGEKGARSSISSAVAFLHRLPRRHNHVSDGLATHCRQQGGLSTNVEACNHVQYARPWHVSPQDEVLLLLSGDDGQVAAGIVSFRASRLSAVLRGGFEASQPAGQSSDILLDDHLAWLRPFYN